MESRSCEWCSTPFRLNPKGSGRRFCSTPCRKSAWRARTAAKGSRTVNADALEIMLADYVVPPSMAAVVTAARELAQAVDRQPGSSGLWAQYRGALADLAPLVAAAEDGELAAVLETIKAAGPGARSL
jgi:uncharacterized alpha-E superfamily protein